MRPMNTLEAYQSLPSEYREYIQENSNLLMEIVDGCPRACWFCDEPNKNGILGYQDEKTIDTFTDLWKPGNFIFFYHNSDPAVWKSGEKRYSSLVESTINKGHRVYTGTSLPRETIQDLIELEKWIAEKKVFKSHFLRISHLPQNTAEIYAFREKMSDELDKCGALYVVNNELIIQVQGDSGLTQEGLGLIEERFTTYGIALGPKTKKQSSFLNIYDLMGRGAIDTLVFKPRGIEVTLAMPHTTISPNGYLRLPFNPQSPVLPMPKLFEEFSTLGGVAYSSNKALEFFEKPNLENEQFIYKARELWVMLRDLSERGVMKRINNDPALSPHKSRHIWFTELQLSGEEGVLTRKEAGEIRKKLETDLIPVLQEDVFLKPYLSLLLEEMTAIEQGTYTPDITS